MKLILGSSSKYRKEVLEKAGYVFEVINPDLDEKTIIESDPYKRPLIVARAKADALLQKISEPAIVIASDIIAICEGELLEKPRDLEEAREFLRRYSEGAVPETVCAVTVCNTQTGKRYEGVDIAKTFFKPIPEEIIEKFVSEAEPLTRAGGFGVQHPILEPYIEKIEGTKESIIGMPLHLLEKLLKEIGFEKN